MRPDEQLVEPLKAWGFRPVARLRPRHAREIAGSPQGVGCGTINRGYVEFAHTGPHLGELGAKHARVQAGWARCEPCGGGRYEWGWLDAVVDGCVAQGVRPWLQTSYGNPAYPGGGVSGSPRASPGPSRRWRRGTGGSPRWPSATATAWTRGRSGTSRTSTTR